MKNEKNLRYTSIIITILSPLISFSIATYFGEVNTFGVAGIVRYSWIMLLFIPFALISILIGIKFKRSKLKYKTNLFTGIACLIILSIFGCYRFIFKNKVSYDINEIYVIEEKTNLNLPDEIKIATNKIDDYRISYIKMINNDENIEFQSEISNNQIWIKEIDSKINELLSDFVLTETKSWDYYVFYNVTTNEYNTYPLPGEYECIFIAYESKTQKLIILENYKITIK